MVEKLKEESFAEGKAEGVAEGIIQTATNMLEAGIDMTLIAKCTGLSISEIKNIKNKII